MPTKLSKLLILGSLLPLGSVAQAAEARLLHMTDPDLGWVSQPMIWLATAAASVLAASLLAAHAAQLKRRRAKARA